MAQKKSNSQPDDWEEVAIDDWEEINPSQVSLSPAPTFRQPTSPYSQRQRAEQFLGTMQQEAGRLLGGLGQAAVNVASGRPIGLIQAPNALFEAGGILPTALTEYLKARPEETSQSVGRGIESGLRGLGSAIETGVQYFPPTAAVSAVAGLVSPELGEEVQRTQRNLVTAGVLGGVAKGVKAIPKVPSGVRSYGTGLKARSAERIGATIGAGESVGTARRAGQFISEFNVPTAKPTIVKGREGIAESRSAGSVLAKEITGRLNTELNQKIFDPATEAGVLIDGNAALIKARELRKNYADAFPPEKSAVAAVDAIIRNMEERLSRSENPGMLTPREAQDLKVLNNKVLDTFYAKIEKAGGQISPLEQVKKQTRREVNSFLRQELEKVNPQVRGINWTEGAGLDVAKALDSYYLARMRRDPALLRGSGITGAAVGNPRLVGLFATTELLAFRPFRIAWNKLLNKVGAKLSGSGSEFTVPESIVPFQASRWNPPIIGNVPTSPQRQLP